MRVLLVEDDPLLRETVAEGLEAIGHTVTMAPCAEDALRAVANGAAPGIVVTDVDLGTGLNGLEFAAHLRERSPGLAIIIMTGQARHLRQRPASALERCLLKPVSIGTIADAIAELACPELACPERVCPERVCPERAEFVGKPLLMARERRHAAPERALHEIIAASHAVHRRSAQARRDARKACEQAALTVQHSHALAARRRRLLREAAALTAERVCSRQPGWDARWETDRLPA